MWSKWHPSSASTEAQSPLQEPPGPNVQATIDIPVSNQPDISEASDAALKPPDGVTEHARNRTRLWKVVGSAVVLLLALSLALGIGLGLGLKVGNSTISIRQTESRMLFGIDEMQRQKDTGPMIELGYARYRGSYLPNGVSQFLGMRYARPPTGELRWRAPFSPEATDSTQQAKEFKPYCLGILTPLIEEEDEDCLYVNVWGPTNATADMKLPVLVFIQGGGYTRNANANWNGSRLVETSGNNIVFVNFNYRVGLWGFLAGEDVRRNGDLNAGLLDQRFLLRWVQKHIHSFGGDPNHVVIQGVSAGAGSAALHLIAYGGRDDKLFMGAISESTFLPAHPPVSQLEYQLDRTMEQAGCQGEIDRMSCLRGKTKEKLQALNAPAPFQGRTHWPLWYWTPCVDGALLEDNPSAMYERGDFIDVPLLFGTCTNEGSVFVPDASSPEDIASFFLDNYPTLSPQETNHILGLYPLEDPVPLHSTYFPSASRAYGEATFICPTNNILNFYSSVHTWSYRYNVKEKDTMERGLGIPHVAEIPAVMGPDMLPYAPHPSYQTYNARAVTLVMNYWLSFTRALNPNVYRAEGAPMWEPWGGNQSRMVLQTHDSVMENVGWDEQARCEFWQSIGSTTNQK